MEILNTVPLSQPGTQQLRVGDMVGFDSNVGDCPLAIGTILSIKSNDKDRGSDECIVVQVGPKVLGIFQAEQLVLLRSPL